MELTCRHSPTVGRSEAFSESRPGRLIENTISAYADFANNFGYDLHNHLICKKIRSVGVDVCVKDLVWSIDACQTKCLALRLVHVLDDIAEAARGVDGGGVAVSIEEVA